MEERKELLADLFDAILDLCYTFEAIHTLKLEVQEGERSLELALNAKCDKSVETLISYLKEMWVKFNYKTSYDVINSPNSVGLFYTDHVNAASYLNMKEFIITTDNLTQEMWISYADQHSLLNVFSLKIRSKYVNEIGALACNCG